MYILSEQRNQEPNLAQRSWLAYQSYLHENEARFPAGAFALAKSDWYIGITDHRAPHDAWLNSATFEELATGEREEVRVLTLRLNLLGAYHDMVLEFVYPRVYAYSISGPAVVGGHYDWHCDEFRLTDNGHLLHEIEWAGPSGDTARWLIEASDVQFSYRARAEA